MALVSFEEVTARPYKSIYKSKRAKAWRNMLVAAINYAVEHSFCDLHSQRPVKAMRYDFTVGEIPAVATCRSTAFDKLSFKVFFWPEDQPSRANWSAEDRAGACASGLFERKHGSFLMPYPDLYCRRKRLETLAALDIPALGYRDSSKFKR
jgi:hypothetical protein